MFDTLQSIAQWALAALAVLIGVHQAAGAIIARGVTSAPSGAPQAAGGVITPASMPAPSDSPLNASQDQPAVSAQPVGLAAGG